jgi:hypothetical protein
MRRAEGKPGLTIIGYQQDGVQTKQRPSPGSISPGFGLDFRPDLLVPGNLKKIPTGGRTRRVFVDSMADLLNHALDDAMQDYYQSR